jgi:hypothetical protein
MAMNGILALILPLKQTGYPDQGLPGSQPHPDQGLPGPQPTPTPPEWQLPHPENPIYYPLPPGVPVDPDYGIDENAPYPDQGLPGDQPRPDQGLPGPQPHPEHPIALPPDSGGWLPVYIWGPTDPRPGYGLPGDQPRPDQGLPGAQPRPDHGLPPFPSHPIELPPDGPISSGGPTVKWKAMWTSTTGWVSFAIVVPGEGGAPHPTPSKKKK